MDFSLVLYSYSYDILQVGLFKNLIYFMQNGSPSPTFRDRGNWMAPLFLVRDNLHRAVNRYCDDCCKMKKIRILALSVICVLSFCSCQKNYQKLIIGKWLVDDDASYIVEDNKRQYYGNLEKDELIHDFEILEWSDGMAIEWWKKNGKGIRAVCHVDSASLVAGEYVFHILSLNGSKMVLNAPEYFSSDFAHIELKRFDCNPVSAWILNIKCSIPIPWWAQIIIIILLIAAIGIVSASKYAKFTWIPGILAFIVILFGVILFCWS